MRQILAIAGAVLVAALVPPIYFGFHMRFYSPGLLAFGLALLWIVLLGLPVFFIFKHREWIRWWSATVSGFFLGAVPMALLAWPYGPISNSSFKVWDGHKMADYAVHGVPTHAGWVQYIQATGGMGLLGAASAVIFWVVWRLIAGPNHRAQ